MQPGELVVINDFIGFIISINNDEAVVRNNESIERTFKLEDLTSIITPYAQAHLTNNKILKLLGKEVNNVC